MTGNQSKWVDGVFKFYRSFGLVLKYISRSLDFSLRLFAGKWTLM